MCSLSCCHTQAKLPDLCEQLADTHRCAASALPHRLTQVVSCAACMPLSWCSAGRASKGFRARVAYIFGPAEQSFGAETGARPSFSCARCRVGPRPPSTDASWLQLAHLSVRSAGLDRFYKHRAPTQGPPRPSDRAATGDLTTTSVCMPISLQLPTGGRCFQPRHAQICHHHRCCRAIPRAAAVEASAPTAQAEPEGPLEPSQFKRDIAEEFTQRAPEYDQSDAYHHSLAESLVSLADIQPGQTVLDVATGTGLVAVVAAHAVGPTGRVFGIDMTHAMLCEVRHAVLGHLGRRPTSARLAFERQCSSEILVNTLLLASNPLGWLQTSNPMQENACDSPLAVASQAVHMLHIARLIHGGSHLLVSCHRLSPRGTASSS